MLSINTNLSSLIAQNSMKTSTNKLNQAVERMSTGYKINHAKDNAANYSIATNMTTKIGAYMVAEDNALQGLDMINTASESLTLIEDKLMRLRALATQASNGTYGTQSLNAINAEAGALVDEINRLYSTAEYNGVSLYDSTKGAGCDLESLPEAGASGFIKEVQRRDTTSMTKLADVAIDQALTSGTYSISTADELAKLATMTNNGLIGKDTEFVLANDIDISMYSTGNGWTPIGNINTDWSANYFESTFDGNGYTINGLTIKGTYRDSATGLFGNTKGAVIKNVGMTNVNINYSGAPAQRGALVGWLTNSSVVENCYSTGSIVAEHNSGGLIGTVSHNNSVLRDSYSTVTLTTGDFADSDSKANVGGLVGSSHGSIINCYASGGVSAGANVFNVGGLVGVSSGLISNSYATGDVKGSTCIGGLVGWLPGTEHDQIGLVENCNSSGSVLLTHKRTSATLARAGGLFGAAEATTVKNCTTTSNVTTTLADAYELYALGGAKGGNGKFKDGVELSGCTYDSMTNNGVNITSENISTANVYDKTKILTSTGVSLQIGVGSTESSQIILGVSFKLGSVYSLKNIGLDNTDYLANIDKMLSKVSEKQTEFGAVQNRLESALDEIATQYENLVSSRSTLRDADLSEESASYIQAQILQQAAATLMSTANQSPAIALQLI